MSKTDRQIELYSSVEKTNQGIRTLNKSAVMSKIIYWKKLIDIKINKGTE